MTRFTVAFLSFTLLGIQACEPVPQGSATSQEVQAYSSSSSVTAVARDALGQMKIGMSRNAVESLGLPFVTSTIQSEGDEYVQDDLKVNENIVIRATIADGKVVELSTSSERYTNPEGAHVGDSLSKLRQIYPGGKVSKGNGEDGLYFYFSTGKGEEYFSFDAEHIGSECVVNDKKCPSDLENLPSVRLHIR